MRVGRSEALDLLAKWAAEGTLLTVAFCFTRFNAAFRGRVFRVSEETIGVVSDDASAELAFRFTADLEAYYGEPRDFPGEALGSKSCLNFVFPSSPDIKDAEYIAFVEPAD